jgi:hypothetical protein
MLHPEGIELGQRTTPWLKSGVVTATNCQSCPARTRRTSAIDGLDLVPLDGARGTGRLEG